MADTSLKEQVEKQARYIEDLEQELRIVKRQLERMKEIAERRLDALYREEYELLDASGKPIRWSTRNVPWMTTFPHGPMDIVPRLCRLSLENL